MNFYKINSFLKQNIIFYITGFLILFGMKYFYSKADAAGLRWILGPTAGWVELLSGIPFAYERGMGYANHSLRFLIAPSCSGVQFMIITAAMLIFSFVHEAADCSLTIFSRRFGFLSISNTVQSAVNNPAASNGAWNLNRCKQRGFDPRGIRQLSVQVNQQLALSTPLGSLLAGMTFLPADETGTAKSACGTPRGRTVRGLCWIMASLLFSYLLTIFVNGLRIIVAIYLPSFFERAGLFSSFLTADRLHTIIGVVVYFAALLTIHQLTELLFHCSNTGNGARDSRQKTASALRLRKCLSPLFWYFFIVLGIPFLNRAYRKGSGRFTDFAFLVTICCGTVLVLYGFASLICKKLKDRN